MCYLKPRKIGCGIIGKMRLIDKMNENTKAKYNLSKLFYLFDGLIVLLILFGFFVFGSKDSFYDLISNASDKGLYLPYLWLFFGGIVLLFFPLRSLCKQNNLFKLCLFIFFVAVGIRLIVVFSLECIQLSDFKNYYDLGINAYYENYEKIASIVAMYQIPTFGGLALLNEMIMKLFSATLFGMQFANCIMAGLTCVALVLIGNYKSISIGAIAGLLYAIYPASVVSVVVTSNTHGAILFNILAILLAVICYKNIGNKKCFLFSVLSMFMFVVSSLFHASSYYTYVLTILFVAILLQMQSFIIEKRLLKKLWICVLIIAVGSNISTKIVVNSLCSAGVISTTESQPFSTTFLIGLNIEDGGRLGENAQANVEVSKQLEGKEKSDYIMSKIMESLADKSKLIGLFMNKQDTIWFESDSWFYWATGGKTAEYQEKESNGTITEEELDNFTSFKNTKNAWTRIDFMYIHILYALAAAALIFRKKDRIDDVINIAVIAILGWIAVFLLTEVQTRYRCYAMPMFMILSSIGIIGIKHYMLLFKEKYLKRKNIK